MFTENNDFFPTPKELTRKMIEKLGVDWRRRIKYILEPSAGKGDLINAYKEIYEEKINMNGYWGNGANSKDLIIDVVEKDENLINILRGQGYNVVFDDFLEYKPSKYYDLIIANFPFSEGDKHFLKAIEIQSRTGGEIIALINSQTLKNTYSNNRKYLAQLLSEYDAEIEYIENAFSEAERKTDVEVALVHVKIPMVKTETIFEREFKRDNPEINFKDINALTVKMNKLQQLVFEYDLVIKSTMTLFEEEIRINKLLEGFGMTSDISICNSNVHAKKLSMNEFIENTNLKFWDRFIKETDLETRLPSKLRNSFRSDMQKQRNIAFNMDNVRYFYEQLIDSIPNSYEQTCGDLFEAVTRKYNYTDNEWNKNIWGYSGWKTNNAYAIQKKIIIPCYLSAESFCYSLPDELLDLNIVFNNIAGIRDNDEFKYSGEIHNRIKNKEKKIESTHFVMDSYKKGTLHVTFKDKKALAVFNYLGSKGKGWLNGDFTTKSYSDMNEEEREVVKILGFEPSDYNTYIGQRKDYLRLL